MIGDWNLLSGVCGYFMEILHLALIAFISVATEPNGAN